MSADDRCITQCKL